MATDTGYARGDYLRVCDICGHRFHFSSLRPIGELRWACPDDAPGLTAIQVSRFNARARPLKIRPNKWAKGLVQTPTYQLSEATIFNLVATTVPGASVGQSAWCGLYLGDVAQSLRPAGWIALTKTSLAAHANFLLANQYGAGIVGTADNPRYGGIFDSTSSTYFTSSTAVAGLAFIRAYQVFGSQKYLQAADRVATFLRHVQSGDLQTTRWTVYPAGGGHYHIGGFASTVNDATGLLDGNYLVADVIGAWFLSELISIRGAAAVYGDLAATAFFSAATSVPLSTMLSEILAFASTGARDSAFSGALTAGLSTTRMRLTYAAALDTTGGAASWATITDADVVSIALAMRGIFQASGMTSQLTGLLAWFMAMTPNPANAIPANMLDSVAIAGIRGTYSPALCVASSVKVSAPFTESTGAEYSWDAQGILSPLLSQSSPSAFTNSKNTIDQAKRFSTFDIATRYIGPLGLSGLNLQPVTSAAGAATTNATRASRTGMIYRQPPGIYPQVALF